MPFIPTIAIYTNQCQPCRSYHNNHNNHNNNWLFSRLNYVTNL